MGTGISPEKILVVLFVALIVLGPDKLPEMARKVGKAWGDLRRYRESLESEVRGAFGVAEGTNPFASPLSFLTDPPPTRPAVDAPPAQPASGTAPVNAETNPAGLTPGPSDQHGAPADVSPATGTADEWAATVTVGWDATGSPVAEAATPPSGTSEPGARASGPEGSQAAQLGLGETAPGQRPVPPADPGQPAWAALGVPADDPSLN